MPQKEELDGGGWEFLLTYILLLLLWLVVDGSAADDGDEDESATDDGLWGGPPQIDLLPQTVFCCGWFEVLLMEVVVVARPLPTLESPVKDAEKPESKLLLLLALLVLLRLRSSWMN